MCYTIEFFIMKRTLGLALLITALMACTSNKNGKLLPKFSYTTLEGKAISSDDLKGGATVICVWATWCGDCIREIPELNDLVDKYADNDKVHFLAFSDEDESTVKKSLNRFPFNFEHIVDSKEYSDKLKSGLTKHFPQVLVIDEDLNIVFDVTENKEKIYPVLDGHIQEILK